MATSLIYRWRREHAAESEPAFLPAMIVGSPGGTEPPGWKDGAIAVHADGERGGRSVACEHDREGSEAIIPILVGGCGSPRDTRTLRRACRAWLQVHEARQSATRMGEICTSSAAAEETCTRKGSPGFSPRLA